MNLETLRAAITGGSVRRVLSLWYIGIVAFVLGLFSVVLYSTVSAALIRDVDRSLIAQAEKVSDAIYAFWRAERAAALSGPGNWLSAPAATLQGEVSKGRLPELIERWAMKTGQLTDGTPTQLLSSKGQPLLSTLGFQHLELPLPPTILEDAVQGRAVYSIVEAAHPFRVITQPVMEDGRVLYLVRVAGSLQHVYDSQHQLRLWLLFLVPVTLLVASVVGRVLGTAAMRPVGRMIAQAQQISASGLDRRLEVPATRDELEQLAVTFNQLLERLERAFKRLRQFSAAASHELRTPLTVMKGELEVALRKPREAAEYQRTLRTHLETIEEMTNTVEELLTLARTDAADLSLERRRVVLDDLAQRVGETWQPVADAKGVRLDVIAPESIEIRGEPRLLERLLANLLDNAIRHTPAQGRVAIKLERRDGAVQVRVTDTGSGIPPEELPHLFDRFFTKPAADPTSRSTGLGLGLCRWIAEAHQGRIEVSSVPGRGTTFTVQFPLPTSLA